MKKILIAICALLVSLSFTGCKKVLEEVPYSFLTPQNFPTTSAEADVALLGCYNPMQSMEMFGYYYALTLNGHSDVERAGGWFEFTAPTYANLPLIWPRFWQGVNAANYLIATLEKMDAANNPWTQVKLAEARAIRAYYYFWLVRLYGDLPLRLTPTVETVLKIPRSPAQEIYDSVILPDIEFADNKLPETGQGGRFTLGAVKAFMGEVYITLAGWRRSSQGEMVPGDPKYWAMARDKFKEVLALETKGVYVLEPSYSKLWTDNSSDVKNREFILDVEFGPGKGSTFPYIFGVTPVGPANGGGQRSLVAQIAWLRKQDSRDTRYQWNVGGYSFTNGWTKVSQPDSTQWGMTKYQKIYPSTAYWQDHLTNWPLYRLAEIKLLFAEAENEANGGPTAEAYDQLNQVRYRARPGDHKTDGTVLPDITNLSRAEFREAVMAEMANEMVTEGKRRFCLIRWDNMEEKIAESNINIRDNGLDKKFYLWDIPITEISLNGWEQNAGH
ncbi:MAG: RagB/SusD family nutrient uptake outer membrane protein [Chitinophagaceae bacterium]|nr:RagB/SusD family nutrient uptake outer membrane protein [Chitinophagaceae bacterium]